MSFEIKLGRIYSYAKSVKEHIYDIPIQIVKDTVRIELVGKEQVGYILKDGFLKHYKLVEQCPM